MEAHYAKQVAGLDVDEPLDTARDMLSAEPRTLTELQSILGARWPKHDPRALAYTVQFLLPLVHVPPRGTWGRGGAVPATMAESWLRRPLHRIRRRTRSSSAISPRFGPAAVADVQMYIGLTVSAPPVDGLRSQLAPSATRRGASCSTSGRAAPRPGHPGAAAVSPRVRQPPAAYADRSRMLTDKEQRAIWTRNGRARDGARGRPRRGDVVDHRTRTSATLEIDGS